MAVKTNPAAGAKGVTLLIMESDREGFRRGKKLKKMGMTAQDAAELFFDDVKVPVTNRLGEEGEGFKLMMQALPQERLGIGAEALAHAQHAYDITVDYVKERKAFGRRVADFQNTRFVLAGLKTRLVAGWALLDQCIEAHEDSRLGTDEASMMKLYATELQAEVVDQCVQFHGGNGYMHEYAISRMYTEARIMRIYGGTSEIMKELISRNI